MVAGVDARLYEQRPFLPVTARHLPASGSEERAA